MNRFLMREGLFKSAISKLIKDHGFGNHFFIETIANLKLREWQNISGNIQQPFTEEDITLFCNNLEVKGKVT